MKIIVEKRFYIQDKKTGKATFYEIKKTSQEIEEEAGNRAIASSYAKEEKTNKNSGAQEAKN